MTTSVATSISDSTTASMPSESDASVFFELVEFLTDSKMQVRLLAIEALASTCDSAGFVEACRRSLTLCQLLARKLIANIGSQNPEHSKKCVATLINVSRIPEVYDVLLNETQVVRRVMEWIRDEQRNDASSECVTLGIMLLANLTRTESGQRQLLGIPLEDQEGSLQRCAALSELFLHYLIKQFVEKPQGTISNDLNSEASDWKPTEYQRHLCVGYILVNVTGLAVGRKCVIQYGKTEADAIHMINVLSRQLLDKECAEQKRLLTIKLFRHLAVDVDKYFNVLLATDSLYLRSLCCVIYPRRGTSERRLKGCSPLPESGGFLTGDASASSSTTHLDEGEEASCVDTFIDANSIGLIDNVEARKDIFDIINSLLTSSPEIRNNLREMGLYEVLRLWHLTETEAQIVYGIEQVVHLLVYSEDELKDQDRLVAQDRAAAGIQ